MLDKHFSSTSDYFSILGLIVSTDPTRPVAKNSSMMIAIHVTHTLTAHENCSRETEFYACTRGPVHVWYILFSVTKHSGMFGATSCEIFYLKCNRYIPEYSDENFFVMWDIFQIVPIRIFFYCVRYISQWPGFPECSNENISLHLYNNLWAIFLSNQNIHECSHKNISFLCYERFATVRVRRRHAPWEGRLPAQHRSHSGSYKRIPWGLHGHRMAAIRPDHLRSTRHLPPGLAAHVPPPTLIIRPPPELHPRRSDLH